MARRPRLLRLPRPPRDAAIKVKPRSRWSHRRRLLRWPRARGGGSPSSAITAKPVLCQRSVGAWNSPGRLAGSASSAGAGRAPSCPRLRGLRAERLQVPRERQSASRLVGHPRRSTRIFRILGRDQKLGVDPALLSRSSKGAAGVCGIPACTGRRQLLLARESDHPARLPSSVLLAFQRALRSGLAGASANRENRAAGSIAASPPSGGLD